MTRASVLASQSTRHLRLAAFRSIDNSRQRAGHTFVLIRPLFGLEKLVPFVFTLLCEQTLWDPGKKICQSDRLLETRHTDERVS
jgi:hypothetical protein